MKIVVPILLLFLNITFGQKDVKLKGVVVEINSEFQTGNIKYLSNVTVESDSGRASPSLSDSSGRFTMIFPDNEVGESEKLQISKYGYVLVNIDDIESVSIGSDEILIVEMAKEGSIDSLKIAIANIGNQSLKNNFEKKIKALESQTEEKNLLLQNLELKIQKTITSDNEARAILYAELEQNREIINLFAAKYSSVNLDDQSSTFRSAFRSYLKSDINKMLELLDGLDFSSRMNTISKDEKKFIQNSQGFKVKAQQKRKELEQETNALILRASGRMLTNRYSESFDDFELALQYNPENHLIRKEYIDFLMFHENYEKAIEEYEIIIQQLRNSEKKVINESILNELMSDYGVALFLSNKPEKASKALNESLIIRRSNAMKGDKYSTSLLVTTLINQSAIFRSYENFKKSKLLLEEAYELLKKEENISIKNQAFIFEAFGTHYFEEKDLEKSRKYQVKSLNLRRKIFIRDSTLIENYERFAGSLKGLALLEKHANNFTEAYKYYDEALPKYRYLAHTFPSRYSDDLGGILTNFAVLNRVNKKYDTAEENYKESIQNFINYSNLKGDEYSFDIGGGYLNYATLLEDNKKIEQAFKAYLEAYRQFEYLSKTNPKLFLPSFYNLLLSFTEYLDQNDLLLENSQFFTEKVRVTEQLVLQDEETWTPLLYDVLYEYKIPLFKFGEDNEIESHLLKTIELFKKPQKENRINKVFRFSSNPIFTISKNQDMDTENWQLQRLVDLYIVLGNFYKRKGKIKDAKLQYSKFVEVLKSMSKDFPKNTLISLDENLVQVIEFLEANNDIGCNFDYYIERIKTSGKLEFYDENFRIETMVTMYNYALQLQNCNETDKARKVLKEILRLDKKSIKSYMQKKTDLIDSVKDNLDKLN